ncbi:MAG: hypothetical protein ACRDS1_00905 [Pseudonocardiaceae bacterium]
MRAQKKYNAVVLVAADASTHTLLDALHLSVVGFGLAQQLRFQTLVAAGNLRQAINH